MVVERLSCNGWAEPDNVSIQPWYCCLSLKVVGVGRFLLRVLGQGDAAGRVCLGDEQSCMHPIK